MARRARKPDSYIVTMTCTVVKHVVVRGCSEQEARENPWDFAEDERETDQIDWEVTSVEPDL